MTTAESNLQKELKKVSTKQREYIQSGLDMLGPDPSQLGHIKNLFFGNINEALLFPYPETAAEETARCDQLLAELDEYLQTEHPSLQIDQEQFISDDVIARLFDMGVLGMTIATKYGGGGFGITLLTAFFEHRAQFHGEALTATQTSANSTTFQLLDTVKQLLNKFGMPDREQIGGSLDYLSKVIYAQANTLGFQDTFLVIAVVALIAVGPAWMIGQTKKSQRS